MHRTISRTFEEEEKVKSRKAKRRTQMRQKGGKGIRVECKEALKRRGRVAKFQLGIFGNTERKK
jgi:hypothetical protein